VNHEVVPVFIMGAPRSGTTLLASLIASHPNIVALPEMHYIFDLMDIEFRSGVISLEKKISILKDDFHFCSMKLFDNLDKLRAFLEYRDSKEIILDIIKLYNDRYLEKEYRLWVEHTPHSHRSIEAIKYYFPSAVFISSVRDPRAVIASTIKEPWGFKDVVTGAQSWNSDVSNITDKKDIYDIHIIRYEDLVVHVEDQLRGICEKLGVLYSDEMMNNDGVVVQDYFGRQRSSQGNEVDKNANAKWKNELTKKMIGHINAVCVGLMEKYGYVSDCEYVREIKGIEKRMYTLIGRLKQRHMNIKFKNEVRELFCHQNYRQ